jgi:hypothetical protein
MRKWTAAAAFAVVLLAGACKREGGEGAGGAEAKAGAEPKVQTGTPEPTDPTVPGGFTVDTQKVENSKGSGQTVNEPD